ncbi:tRNA pseudouridine synthase B [Paucilactobacillus hokkaidonensis JCM 18461]|uniref:tRNA pseudouridine synthase B n=2 Tax=Paucilactobacillus hokkaidonensis TaxID=1193095 RepID=A0A0A1GU01_9LACO|nr:tRNA pseudouridine(55) synthase TruB [Paucilactobacillus hokkaidonensis]KRO10740.1 tRNA pseudouridine synthase B [Paucilactobacillus hokkaidonensis]BAP85732.1 tRNA pseudouridine synthase B [Paucilactobacillus hokkaidonensis JCM 18461]
MDGIIPLFKERGMTSHDCVNQLRKILHTKKIGHSGTLDPNVDGVLPICIGRATKVVEYLMESGKKYEGELYIGQATTTQDLDGDVIETKPLNKPFSDEEIITAMKSLTGTITQIPPMYSAIKVNGRKLYEYARAGETVKRPTRLISVTKFELISTSFDEKSHSQRVRFAVECGKGTYIRTLVVDLAKQLGFPGVMSDLTRTQSGGFELGQTMKLAEIKVAVEQNTIDQKLFPLDYALAKFPVVELSDELWQAVQHGIWLTFDEVASQKPVVALRANDQIKALYQRNEERQCYKPLRMFSIE